MPNRYATTGLTVPATDQTIQGKLLAQWDLEWKRVDGGFLSPHPELRHQIGLFRAMLNDRVMFIGIGTEDRNGGLAKRIADFTRTSPSARRHQGGQNIFDHKRDLALDVLTLAGASNTRVIAKRIKAAMIERHRPAWNVPKNVVDRPR